MSKNTKNRIRSRKNIPICDICNRTSFLLFEIQDCRLLRKFSIAACQVRHFSSKCHAFLQSMQCPKFCDHFIFSFVFFVVATYDVFFVVATYDLVQGMETIFLLKSFLKYE